MAAKKHAVFPTIHYGNMSLGMATTEAGAMRLLRKEMGDKVNGVRFGWDFDPKSPEAVGRVNRFGYFAVTEIVAKREESQMTTYFATIRHHSIARARVIKIEGTITEAKRAATGEFKGDFNDYVLTIFGTHENGEMDRDYIVSSRRLGARKWHDAEA